MVGFRHHLSCIPQRQEMQQQQQQQQQDEHQNQDVREEETRVSKWTTQHTSLLSLLSVCMCPVVCLS
jgi:hypothetical protein